MIEEVGDMFDCGDIVIGHGCNTQGLMGAGVAGIVARRFPLTKVQYVALCADGRVMGGDVLVTVELDGERENAWMIFNMMTQVLPGANADLELIRMAAEEAVKIARQYDIGTIHIPQIGCGIGGLDWSEVKRVFQETETDDFEWTVWTLEQADPDLQAILSRAADSDTVRRDR